MLKRRGSNLDNPYLFPSYGMKHRHKQLITRHWVARCRDAGIVMDLHVHRHLVAKLVLDQDPTAMSLVQEILGHDDDETMRAYYADVNKGMVHKNFQLHWEEIEMVLTIEIIDS